MKVNETDIQFRKLRKKPESFLKALYHPLEILKIYIWSVWFLFPVDSTILG